MIRDVSINKSLTSGNAISADIAKLEKNRQFVLDQAQGKDVSALIAYYDQELARLRSL